MLNIIGIIKYLTSYVILKVDNKLDEDASWSVLYKSVMKGKTPYLTNIEMVYLNKMLLLYKYSSKIKYILQ